MKNDLKSMEALGPKLDEVMKNTQVISNSTTMVKIINIRKASETLIKVNDVLNKVNAPLKELIELKKKTKLPFF